MMRKAQSWMDENINVAAPNLFLIEQKFVQS